MLEAKPFMQSDGWEISSFNPCDHYMLTYRVRMRNQLDHERPTNATTPFIGSYVH